MSPTSLKVTLHELNLGANFSLGECLQMEYRLGVHFVEDSDFHEGNYKGNNLKLAKQLNFIGFLCVCYFEISRCSSAAYH